MRRFEILDDDAPRNSANRLVITQSDDGDIWLAVKTNDNGIYNMSGSIRIRTFSGGGSHPELINYLNSMLNEMEKLITDEYRSGSIEQVI